MGARCVRSYAVSVPLYEAAFPSRNDHLPASTLADPAKMDAWHWFKYAVDIPLRFTTSKEVLDASLVPSQCPTRSKEAKMGFSGIPGGLIFPAQDSNLDALLWTSIGVALTIAVVVILIVFGDTPRHWLP